MSIALTALWAVAAAVRARIPELFGAFWAFALALAVWLGWSHWVALSHHWTQRDLLWRYHAQLAEAEATHLNVERADDLSIRLCDECAVEVESLCSHVDINWWLGRDPVAFLSDVSHQTRQLYSIRIACRADNNLPFRHHRIMPPAQGSFRNSMSFSLGGCVW